MSARIVIAASPWLVIAASPSDHDPLEGVTWIRDLAVLDAPRVAE